MTFISYALNSEDVLLWRTLGHVNNGFYIDVGANDPKEHSVTKAFYDRGWRGINIEPLPRFAQPLHEQRPRDVNLSVAAGASEGEITLFDVPAVNGWATNDAQVARTHQREGLELVEMRVPVRTLVSICEEHVNGDIHFLKVDVEGFEPEVLKGMDFVRWRPWVVVVEATQPNSDVLNHQAWEYLVLEPGYVFTYFDGLNRYYVAVERAGLMATLAVQPNVFDHFISAHLVDVQNNAQATWEREKNTEARLTEEHRAGTLALQRAMQAELQNRDHAQEIVLLRQKHALALETQTRWAQSLEQRVIAMERSLSWRLTAPLRRLAGSRIWHPNLLLKRVLNWLMRRNSLQRLLLPVIQRFPALNARLVRVAASLRSPAQAPSETAAFLPTSTINLPVSTRKVFADLSYVCGVPFTS